MDAETPARRVAARKTRVVHLLEERTPMGKIRGKGGGGKKGKNGGYTYASIKKAAQPPCKLPSGLSMSNNTHNTTSFVFAPERRGVDF